MRVAIVRVAVIVVSHGRTDWLERCLLSVARAVEIAKGSGANLNVKLRVMINGEDEPSFVRASEVCGHLEGIQADVVYRRIVTTPGNARNELLRNETAEWICFVDDDAFVPENYFVRWLLNDLASFAAIGGPNLTPPGATAFAEAAGLALSSQWATYLSFRRYRAMRQGSPASMRCGEESLILCNLFVRRTALGRDPFPSELSCGEENVMLERIAASGGHLSHDPGLVVFHERRGDPRAFMRQVFFYGRSRAYFGIQGSVRLRLAHLLPPLACGGLVGIPGVLLLPSGAIGLGLTGLLYLSLSVVAALSVCRSGRNRFGVLVRCVGLFPMIHFSYGAGFLAGGLQVARERMASPGYFGQNG